jgi:hypothetical protein
VIGGSLVLLVLVCVIVGRQATPPRLDGALTSAPRNLRRLLTGPSPYGVVDGKDVVESADVSGVVASCGVGSGDVGCSAGGSDDGSDDGSV